MKKDRRSFIKKSTVLTAALGMSSFMPSSTNAKFMDTPITLVKGFDLFIKSGFSERDITPDIGMEQPGDYNKNFNKISIHDPSKVRAVVFNESGKRVAIVGLDALELNDTITGNIRKRIYDRCGISPDAILIGASHSHSSGPIGGIRKGEFDHADKLVQWLAYEKSPGTNERYLQHVENQIVEAVCQADMGCVEAQMGVGKGMEGSVAFNRRFRMKNGLTYTHPGQLNPDIVEPAGPIDPEVGVIGVWNKEGKCIGCVVNYTCHATTNPGGSSANWIYYMEQTIKGAMGTDCIVVFIQGACGDVTQVNNLNPYVNLSGEDWTRFVGGKVGAEAVKVLLTMPRGSMMPLDFRVKVIDIKRRIPSAEHVKEAYAMVKQTPEQVGNANWLFAKETILLDAMLMLKKNAIAKVEVQTIQVGPAVFVSNPAELFCQLGLNIKANSPFKYTFIAELANGYVGYVPTAESFNSDGGGYETRLTSESSLEIEAGNKMVEAGIELVHQMKPGIAPSFTKAKPFSGKSWDYGNIKPQID